MDTRNINTDGQNKLSKARYAAYNAIEELSKQNSFARDILNKVLKEHVLSSVDKAFASKLTLGVTQTMSTLDEIIYRCVESPQDIKLNVLNALRISTYEIIYLEKESHAAVDQGVELVKQVEPKASGLANFVLRRVVDEKKKFPYGNPDEDMEAFARVYALPKWQCDMIVESLGEKFARYLIASCNGQPPCYIFANSVKSSIDEVFELLKNNEAKPQKIGSLCGLKINNCILVGNPAALMGYEINQAYKDGKFLISDIASQAVVQSVFLSSYSARSILEIGSGKGTKTIMFQAVAASKLQRQLEVTTIDNAAWKTNVLQERCKRYGAMVKNPLTADVLNDKQLNASLRAAFEGLDPNFDIVFVDAPCSGLGTLRRHPELKWRLNPQDVHNMAKQGLQMLKNASKYVYEGGNLVYSTCTVTNIENENVCKKFLESEEGKSFRLLKFTVDDKTYDYFRTQTFTGLNDVHFCATFYKVSS